MAYFILEKYSFFSLIYVAHDGPSRNKLIAAPIKVNTESPPNAIIGLPSSKTPKQNSARKKEIPIISNFPLKCSENVVGLGSISLLGFNLSWDLNPLYISSEILPGELK